MPTKSPPYVPWWVNDYFTGSQRFTTDARYVYSELLWAQWYLGGRLPTDVRELRRLARAESWSLRRFRKVWKEVQAEDAPAYRPKFKADDRGLYNERLEKELGAATGQTETLSDAGRRGALARWGCRTCKANGRKMAPKTLKGDERVCPTCGEDPSADPQMSL